MIRCDIYYNDVGCFTGPNDIFVDSFCFGDADSLLLVLQSSICTYLLVPDTIFKQKELRLELNKLVAFFSFLFIILFPK